MRKIYRAICCCVLFVATFARAGTEASPEAVADATQASEAVPLDLFTIESGYVFKSDLNHGGSFGKQDELQFNLEYGHRIQLVGNYYLHLGFSYDRYDFGSTSAPVPDHLQSIAGVFGVEYMHGSNVGAFLQVRPGFYFQNEIGLSSFDAPITLGRIFVIKEKRLYIMGGAYASFLRGGFPVLPLLGVIWIPSDHIRLMAVPPNPRLIYSPTNKLDLWVGGEIVADSYRTDRNNNILPTKLRGAQVNFGDYRAGAGLTYTISKSVLFETDAGYSVQRQFDFARAGETYRTDPAPYVRVQFSAGF
jgi:hypothetical protein